MFGDSTRSAVLHAAGVGTPKAIAVCFSDREQALSAVRTFRVDYPATPIYACAADLRWVEGGAG
jgi:glutathione-regulated potassium-efflux system protein KefB